MLLCCAGTPTLLSVASCCWAVLTPRTLLASALGEAHHWRLLAVDKLAAALLHSMSVCVPAMAHAIY